MGADEREWVAKKWRLIRRSQRFADQADEDWVRVNDEINDYLDRSGVFDVVARVREKNVSIALTDALDVGSWHAANARRHIDDLSLFLRLKELGLL
jgi:hypothetical protein